MWENQKQTTLNIAMDGWYKPSPICGVIIGFTTLWYFGGTCAKMMHVAGHLRPEPAWNQAGCGWCGGHVHRCRVLCVPDEVPWNIHWRIRGVASWVRRTVGGFQNFLLVYPYLQTEKILAADSSHQSGSHSSHANMHSRMMFHQTLLSSLLQRAVARLKGLR